MKLASHYKEMAEGTDPRIINWRENSFGESLYYSYRTTHYTRKTFPSRLHCHDYYELVVFETGDIHYICESSIYQPKSGDILLIPPGMFHMSAIRCEQTLYKRHVFYLYPGALDFFGCGALTEFLVPKRSGLHVFSLETPRDTELLQLLHKLDKALELRQDPAYHALSISYLIQAFFLLNQGNWGPCDSCTPLPQNLSAIKAYVDEHFRELDSTKEIAAHFFYSREYVSRLFRKHFNATVSEYIKARRIAYSQSLLEQGCPISEACYECGFENMSTFIRVFRSVVHMTPSEYRKKHLKKA